MDPAPLTGPPGAPPAERLPELDALRGIAAVLVLVHHAVQMVPPLPTPDILGLGWLRWVTLNFTPLRVAEAGRPAVLFFFALSGYVLTRALLRSGSPGLAAFAAQRSIRLMLPAAASVALCIGLYQVFFNPAVPKPLTLYTWLTPPTAWEAAVNALLLARSEEMRLNIVLWSLAHEWRLTLLLPLVLLFRGRLASLAALILLAVALGLVGGAEENRVLIGHTWPHTLAATLYFAAGIGGGVLLALWRPQVPTLTREQALAAGLACMALFSMASDIAAYAGSALLIVLAQQPGALRQALRTAPLLWLGRVSFSLYLVHVPVLVATLHALHGALDPLAVAAIGSVLALPAASVMHRLVEAPSRGLARRAERRLASPHRITPPRIAEAPRRAQDWSAEGGLPGLPRG